MTLLRDTQIQDETTAMDMKVTAEKFLQQLDAIHELPTLSTVALQISRMLQDINISAQDVAKIIQNDQSIVTKMLKLVNSAFFGFSTKVSSVQHALMLLGFNTVRNAVISIDVISVLKMNGKIKGFDISSFWRHAVGVAVISRYLDQATGNYYREDVFTAGIIHDIGKVVMAHYFSDRFQAVWDTMRREQLNFWDAEHRHFPLNHAEIGAELANRWHLPERMRDVIGRHHLTSKNVSVDNLVHIVHAADALLHVFLEHNSPTEDWPISAGARQLLKQQIRSADQWIPGLKREIKEACQMFMEA
jgi:putative nucleotidyltransferase with HDIG domain